MKRVAAYTVACNVFLLTSSIGYPSLGFAQSKESPVRVGGSISIPERTVWVPPKLPPDAQKTLRGTVALELTIDPEGQVAAVRVIKSIPEAEAAVIAAAKQWKYAPTTVGGKPAWVKVITTVQFGDLGDAAAATAPIETRSCDSCAPGERREYVEVRSEAAATTNQGDACGAPPNSVLVLAKQLVDSAIASNRSLADRPIPFSDAQPDLRRAAEALGKHEPTSHLMAYQSNNNTRRCVPLAIHLPRRARVSRFAFLTDAGGGHVTLCSKGTDCGKSGRFIGDTPMIVATPHGQLIYSVYDNLSTGAHTVQFVIFYKESGNSLPR